MYHNAHSLPRHGSCCFPAMELNINEEKWETGLGYHGKYEEPWKTSSQILTVTPGLLEELFSPLPFNSWGLRGSPNASRFSKGWALRALQSHSTDRRVKRQLTDQNKVRQDCRGGIESGKLPRWRGRIPVCFHLSYLLAMWIWASYLVTLSFKFLI